MTLMAFLIGFGVGFAACVIVVQALIVYLDQKLTGGGG